MDIDILIAAVFKRNPIWDKRNKLHRNRNCVDTLWKEISAEIKQDETKIRKKWKYLRDQFAVELGKIPLQRSGDPADSTLTCKWIYFKPLLFLKGTVRPRTSTGSLSNAQKFTQETYEEESQFSIHSDRANEDDDSFVEHVQDEVKFSTVAREYNTLVENTDVPSSDLKTIATVTPTVSRKRREIDEFNASMLEIEKRKLEYLEAKKIRRDNASEQEDEHILFFKSILPHVKKIPESNILSFRSEVHGLVEQYQLNRVSSRPASSASSYSASRYPEQNATVTVPSEPSQDNNAYNFSSPLPE